MLLCAGTTLLLAERSKWAEGRFLAVDLDAALERADTTARGELETIAALFSADAIVPGRLGDQNQATSVLDDLGFAPQRLTDSTTSPRRRRSTPSASPRSCATACATAWRSWPTR